MNEAKLISVLYKKLGNPIKFGSNLKYNCPLCEQQGGLLDKHNLEVDYQKFAFHCWSCSQHGSIRTLIKRYAPDSYNECFPRGEQIEVSKQAEVNEPIRLPSNLVSVFQDQKTVDHLISRGFTKNQLKKYKVKYCFDSQLKGYAIFPSYTASNELNYWIAYNPSDGKYWKCKGVNLQYCFWESNIDFDSPIVLVEGIFDTIAFPNCLPLLGLKVNQYLLEKLANKTVILVLDSFVISNVRNALEKELNGVAKQLIVVEVSNQFKDPNEAFVKGFRFQDILKPIYLSLQC